MQARVRAAAPDSDQASAASQSVAAAAPLAQKYTARSGKFDLVLVHFDPANVNATLAFWLDFLGMEKVRGNSFFAPLLPFCLCHLLAPHQSLEFFGGDETCILWGLLCGAQGHI